MADKWPAHDRLMIGSADSPEKSAHRLLLNQHAGMRRYPVFRYLRILFAFFLRKYLQRSETCLNSRPAGESCAYSAAVIKSRVMRDEEKHFTDFVLSDFPDSEAYPYYRKNLPPCILVPSRQASGRRFSSIHRGHSHRWPQSSAH